MPSPPAANERPTVTIDRTSEIQVEAIINRFYQLQRFAQHLAKGGQLSSHLAGISKSDSFQLNLAFAQSRFPLPGEDADPDDFPLDWMAKETRPRLSSHLGAMTKFRNKVESSSTGNKATAAAAANEQGSAPGDETGSANVTSEETHTNLAPVATSRGSSSIEPRPGASTPAAEHGQRVLPPTASRGVGFQALPIINSLLPSQGSSQRPVSFPGSFDVDAAVNPDANKEGHIFEPRTTESSGFFPNGFGLGDVHPGYKPQTAKETGQQFSQQFNSNADANANANTSDWPFLLSSQQHDASKTDAEQPQVDDNEDSNSKQLARWYRAWYAEHTAKKSQRQQTIDDRNTQEKAAAKSGVGVESQSDVGRVDGDMGGSVGKVTPRTHKAAATKASQLPVRRMTLPANSRPSVASKKAVGSQAKP